MDHIDKTILNIIQSDFPVCAAPYDEIGRRVGISGKEALERVRMLVKDGVVRKVGPFFDAPKMGHKSTLCAVQVPDEKVSVVTGIIASYPEITHNYLREGNPNLWFTVIASNEKRINEILTDISARGEVGPIFNLPARMMFKVKVDLNVTG